MRLRNIEKLIPTNAKLVEQKTPCYNSGTLGIRLAVGQRTLDPYGQVRILDPQPT
jgi:hypothetical protein